MSSGELKPRSCICRSWCRSDLWGQMIDGHRYPASNHADGCPAQMREPFTALEHDGTRCVMEPHEAAAIMSDEPGVYTSSTVMIERGQFERMEEFSGF